MLAGAPALLVEAGDLTRKRIERDLHDGAQQRVVALALALRMAESRWRREERLPERVETAAYFVASEALANVGKYANASTVAIRLSRHNGVAVIAIDDDGVGSADPAGGSGLRGLADRVASVGGRLEVVSPPGAGTTLIAEMPCGFPETR